MSAPRRLPPELTDRIIDFLWNDRTALRTCSLVCTAWRSASQYHLFSLLAFDSAPQDVERRLRGLRDSPHLLAHVRVLRFVDSGTLAWDRFARALYDMLPAVRPAGAAFIARQQHVIATLPFIAPPYASLQSLVLRGAIFGSAAHFALAVAPLRGLRHLEVDPLLLANDEPAIVRPQFDHACTVRVTLVDGRLAALAPWIEAGGRRGNVQLRALSAALRSENLGAFDTTLRSQADSLWMLRVTVPTLITAEFREAVCSSMSSCRVLRILIFDPEASIPDYDFIELIASVIRTAVHPARLVVNTAALCHVRHDGFGGMDWEQLDDAAFNAGMTTVQISADTPQEWNAQFETRARAALVNAMPRLARAGRLTFVPTRKTYTA
ncbi:hypothetical protein AURDEDRAFT_174238 [Auricularia subglabra TFB-10046 SS5]|uniref:F-box domain-containing protein n=1 Tax=Auricularia subglabra (strain TFB-10046 / SS5) TaxID=717982 RepID=J0WTJ0_AURST|nr:hypothetical protein AURDEDRAFT_174238 [Auricularia subglabra TFB-10046 SS5]